MDRIRWMLILGILLIMSALQAQHHTAEGNKSLDPEMSLTTQQFDSLYQAWLNGKLPVRVYIDSAESRRQGPIAHNYSDSVIRQRLREIPSTIPLTYNDRVKNYIDLYLGGRSRQVSLLLGLADYYFPILEPILDAHDLPHEFKYMAIIESGLNPLATSRAGARGLWQFMHGTARLYKMTMNSYIDERHDPVRSTEAACRYLKELHNIFNDWILVIAAYNCGPGNVNKAIRRAGGKTNYWDIYPYLPRETRGHVPAFIAMTYVMNYAWDYDFQPYRPVVPLLTDTLMIHEDLHFGQISGVLGIPVSTLQALNPVFRRNIIPAAGGPYALVLPAEQIPAFIDRQNDIFTHRDDHYFNQANIDRSPATRIQPSPPPAGNYTRLTYTVKQGDNLGFIADWYGVGVSKIKDWNGLNDNLIRVGQRLAVYVPEARTVEFEKIDQLSFQEKQQMKGKGLNAATAVEKTTVANAAAEDDHYVYYTVKPGDNLWTIAKRFEGVTDSDIKRLNQLASNNLKPGMVLKIKPKEG